MDNLAIALHTATERYRALAEVLAQVDLLRIFANDANLAEIEKHLIPYQEAAQEADQRLQGLFGGDGDSANLLPLMFEYQEVLRRVADLNSALLSRARTHLALIASELTELKEGKVALAGYRVLTDQRGQVLSENF